MDRYTIKVLKNDEIVGHLSKKISMLCLFIRRGGLIKSEVTGSRRYSQDLVQGGLEIPCDLVFEGRENDNINKLKSQLPCRKLNCIHCLVRYYSLLLLLY